MGATEVEALTITARLTPGEIVALQRYARDRIDTVRDYGDDPERDREMLTAANVHRTLERARILNAPSPYDTAFVGDNGEGSTERIEVAFNEEEGAYLEHRYEEVAALHRDEEVGTWTDPQYEINQGYLLFVLGNVLRKEAAWTV